MKVFRLLNGLLLGLLLLGACGPARALSLDETLHLLRRTGFGPRSQDIAALQPLSRAAAVDRLLATTRTVALTPAPAFTPPARMKRQPVPAGRNQSRAQNQAQNQRRQQRLRSEWESLKSWWLQEMLTTPSPLTESMTLFWHNHFTSSLKKVRLPELMYRQNLLLRQQAVGNFASLLQAIYKDPAMLRYLDGAANRQAHPNENFARELLELFTLGEGHYSEADIKAAARAFTGWGLDARGQAVFRPRQHDAGLKTFLGQTGPWQGEDIIRMLLAQPRTAEYIVGRLWRQLISPQPDLQLVKTWAAGFRRNYEIKPLLRTMLTSDAFWNTAQRGSLIKSPIELAVGSFRSLNLRPDAEGLVRLCRQLGQDIFDPPNVKGWPGGQAWIDTRTLVQRQQFLRRLAQMNPQLDTRLATLPLSDGRPAANLLGFLLDERYQLK